MTNKQIISMECKQFEIECRAIDSTTIKNLPTEILIKIFNYLRGTEIFKCRRVCKLWKTAGDLLTQDERSWQKLCVKDFKNIYDDARRKSSLSHENLYKSLSLWPRVGSAIIDGGVKFISVPEEQWYRRFLFEIVNCNTAGITKCEHCEKIDYCDCNGLFISYYNLEKTVESNRLSGVDASITHYKENEHFIVVAVNHTFRTVDYKHTMTKYIVPKINGETMWDKPTIISMNFVLPDCDKYLTGISVFLIHNRQVYYRDNMKNDNVCVVSMDEHGELCNKVICETRDIVPVAISYCNGTVYFVSNSGQIYSISGNEYVLEQPLLPSALYLYNLRKYNFCLDFYLLQGLGFREYGKVLGYGDIVLHYQGVEPHLDIFYAPLSDGPLDILDMEPIISIDLSHLFGDLLLEHPFEGYHMDVKEVEDGHELWISVCNFSGCQSLGILPLTHRKCR